ncbi:hypothetical protein BaRGS_00020253 [Batillaria attramentaria]|uniref:Uncharacterized protein n=1 Tax=Batillaria attramentaria TaxID=370345 RepID=A0ABD0KMG3_9CAEN
MPLFSVSIKPLSGRRDFSSPNLTGGVQEQTQPDASFHQFSPPLPENLPGVTQQDPWHALLIKRCRMLCRQPLAQGIAKLTMFASHDGFTQRHVSD